ncbi:hypothetical protein T439DRAFT_57636 [Meredithblackwellia eburnea MCA 4105]
MGLHPNPVAENVLGTMGAVLWSIQLCPQIYKSYVKKDTRGLSASMLAIWFCSGLFLGGYSIAQRLPVPLLIQPQLFCLFTAIAWAQCLVYEQEKTPTFATVTCIIVCVVSGGIELALVYGARALEVRGNNKATTAWGILSTISILAGFVPQYIEIFRLRAVIGISLVFLFVDMGGAVFSSLALLFTPEGHVDILALSSYGSAFTLEAIIFILAGLLNPLHRKRVEAAKKAAEQELSGIAECSEVASGPFSAVEGEAQLPPLALAALRRGDPGAEDV